MTETPIESLPHWAFCLGSVQCRFCLNQQTLEGEEAIVGHMRIFLVEDHKNDCLRAPMNDKRTWEYVL